MGAVHLLQHAELGLPVCCRHIKESANAFDKDHKLHTFSIGIGGSPDLIAARKVWGQGRRREWWCDAASTLWVLCSIWAGRPNCQLRACTRWHGGRCLTHMLLLRVLCCQVADFLGTVHHEFTFTVEEGIDALYDLIYHIESYEQVGRVCVSVGLGGVAGGW